MKKDLSWNISARVLSIRTILLVFWLMIFASKAMAQTTWNGSISTDWFTASNWSSGVPTAGTNVTIPSGGSNLPVINGTGAVCNNLTINSGASLTISGTNELAISGSFSNSGTFDAGNSTVTYNGAAQTVVPVLYHNLVLAGSGIKTITGLDTVGGNFIMDGDNTTFAATGTNPSGPILSIGGDMIINAGNTFVATNGSPTLNVHGNTSISGTVTSPGGGKNFYGDFTINAGGNWTENGGSPPYTMYGNITNNGTFALVSTSIPLRLAGSGKTLNGNLSIGTLTMLSGSSYTNTGDLTVLIINNPGTLIQDENAVLTVGNNITGNTILIATAPGNTVNYTGTIDQTVRTSEFYHLNLGGSGTKSFTAATYTVNGNLSIDAGTTLEASPGIAIELKGDLTNNGTFTASTSTVSFTGSTAQTIGGSAATSVYNLTIGAGATIEASPGITIDLKGDFTNNGTFIPNTSTVSFTGSTVQTIGGSAATSVYDLTLNSGASLTISGANELAISGSFSNSGTFDAGSSTVTYNGAAQTVVPVLYHNLVLAGSGIKTITGLDTVGGNFIMDGDNTTFAAPSTKPIGPVFSIGGDMIINAGNTFVATNGSPTLNVHGNTSISGTVASPGGGKNFYGDFTINAGGNWTDNGGGPAYTMYGNVTNNGTLALTSPNISMRLTGNGKTLNGDISVGTLWMLSGSSYTNTGNLTVLNINSTGTLIQDEGAVLTVSNILTSDVNLIATAPDNIVNYTGTTDQTVTISAYYHLNLGGSGTKSFTAATYTVNGNLSIDAGTTLEASPGIAIELKGDLTNNGTFTASTSTVSFTGGTAQTVDGSSATSAYNLTMDNGAGLSLSQDLSVDGTLTFSNGIITSTASNLLTFSNGSAASGSGTGKYVDGPVRKAGNSDFTFPIGKSGVYAPLSISAPAVSTDAFTAEYMRLGATALGSISASGLAAVSACEYWDLDRSTGTSNVNVTLSWSGSSPCSVVPYIEVPSSVVVAHFDGTNWDSFANDGGTTGDATSGTVTWNNVSAFSPFTIGTTNSQDNPLPLKFGSIKASVKNNSVQVDWVILMEADVKNYEVERSSNGQSFVTIGQREAIANYGQGANYTWLDALPPAGDIYYRIKSVDIDGKLNYSAIVRINLDASGSDLLFYPNPAVDKRVSFQSRNLAKGQYQLLVTDMKGTVVYSETFTHAGGAISQSLQLPASVAAGIYNLRVKSKSGGFNRTFIVR